LLFIDYVLMLGGTQPQNSPKLSQEETKKPTYSFREYKTEW